MVRETAQLGVITIRSAGSVVLACVSVQSVNIHCHVPMPLSEGRAEKINIMLLRSKIPHRDIIIRRVYR